MYFAHPPGTITVSLFDFVNLFLKLSVRWTSEESQASKHWQKQNWTKISLHQRNINSSFIHLLAELATEYYLLNSLWRAVLSHLKPLNIMKHLNLVPFAFLVRQTETRTLSCPVDFMRTSFEPIFSTVALETISFETNVSSIVIMSHLWKISCFWLWRTCITYATIRSTIYHASFWAVLFFLLREHTGLRFDSMLKWEAVSPFTVCCNTEVTSVTCGHHVYKEVWDAAIGELPEPASDYREEAKEYDKYAVGPY